MANDTVTSALERPKGHRENRKKNRGRKVEDNQARAVAKFVRVPPRKARLVIDEVRGRYASEALAFLRFIPNRAAGFISKVVASAVANAVNNHDLDLDRLKVVECRVDEGPRMKRVQPRAQGRAYRILKRMSHITVTVQEVEPKPRKPRKVTRTRAAAARAARQPQPTAAPTPAPTAVEPEVTMAAVAEPIVEVTAPVHTEAVETVAEQAQPVTEAHAGEPETANTEDKTDEIGAPIDVDAEKNG
jgi:large subunit ribosomal protein L22